MHSVSIFFSPSPIFDVLEVFVYRRANVYFNYTTFEKNRAREAGGREAGKAVEGKDGKQKDNESVAS